MSNNLQGTLNEVAIGSDPLSPFINSKPLIHFYLSDWFTELRLSAVIPVFDPVWKMSTASAAFA